MSDPAGRKFAGLSDFWPLLLVAFVGTLNPSSGDGSIFLPLEHSRLSLAHIPANLFLVLAALAPNLGLALTFLFFLPALSQMDVPTRFAYVRSVVTPPERAAAASFTAVPQSLAAALGPSLGGALLASGWLAAPQVACACLKIGYDLALWRAFRQSGQVVSNVQTK